MVWRTAQLTGIKSGPHIVDIDLIAASCRKDGVLRDNAMHVRNSGRGAHVCTNLSSLSWYRSLRWRNLRVRPKCVRGHMTYSWFTFTFRPQALRPDHQLTDGLHSAAEKGDETELEGGFIL